MSQARGVIYMCWGEQAIQQAQLSMRSLWEHVALPVLVVGDTAAGAHFADVEGVAFAPVDVDPFDLERREGQRFLAGRIKPLLYGLSPFDESLYVDADTDFAASPEAAFDLLERWDFILAETQTRSLATSIADPRESQWSSNWLGTGHLLYHNSGMLFWRRGEAVEQLFRLWSEEWQRFQSWDEQVALLRALLRSEALYLTVPYTWNCREGAKATLLHHQFGTKIARAGVHTSRLVRVQVAPGRYTKCRPEHAEMYRQRYAAQARRPRQQPAEERE
jgi:hypothetical protein